MMPFPAGASIKNRAFGVENLNHIRSRGAQARELNLAIWPSQSSPGSGPAADIRLASGSEQVNGDKPIFATKGYAIARHISETKTGPVRTFEDHPSNPPRGMDSIGLNTNRFLHDPARYSGNPNPARPANLDPISGPSRWP